MRLAHAIKLRLSGSRNLSSHLAFSAERRNLRMASGLILFAYVTAHLINHALGLVSLDAAEQGMGIAITVWYRLPGTVLLYGAAATHFLLALWAVYERRTFRLPPAELLRIALGFTMPMILIGHFANTRLAYELFGLSADYSRVIANLWAADSQGMQLGLLAPGWLHGCLGLHLAFNRRPLYRQWRFVLFAVAILLPVFSAFGFIAMGRELATNPSAVAAAQAYLGAEHAVERAGLAYWHNQLLVWYFSIIGMAFAARRVRNALERGSKRLIAITYPERIVRVPRGWSVLEASRGFHLPHASMCGGRARCSTCRVRVTAGGAFCPPMQKDEQATLLRIGAAPDVRLACQLRPLDDISVVPLVQTERPAYRISAPQRSPEREVIVMFCDFLNRDELAHAQLPQDMLYLLKLYGEALGKAIRQAGGTLSTIGPNGICALFGLECEPARAAQRALMAASAIEQVIADLGERLGREGNRTIKIAVSIHAGRVVVGEIGSTDPPAVIAVGDAVDVTDELRKAAAAHGTSFAISEAVTTAASVPPALGDRILVGAHDQGASTAAWLSASAPILPFAQPQLAEWRAALRRLWSG
jgi:adenylate cyclase